MRFLDDSFIENLFFVERWIIPIRLKSARTEVFLRDVTQIVSSQIVDRQFSEDVIDHRGRHADAVVSSDHPVRFEAREEERFDELLQRHSML